MSKPIYCGLAFGSVSMGTSGELRPCCAIMPNRFDSRATFGTSHISERINCHQLVEVRSSLMNGVWHPACGNCENQELAGSKSMRLIWNDSIPTAPMSETLDPANVKYMDISLGNKCNSKCMTCNPSCSDFWIDEYNINTNLITKYTSLSISRTMIDQLFDTFTNVEFINILGGEPLFSDEHGYLLSKLISTGMSKNITLSYVSNLTVYDESIVESWKNFKSVGASLSMDGIGLVNDYLRYPAKFDKIESNLKRYLSLVESSNFGMTLSCTISALNFHAYPKLLDYYASLVDRYSSGKLKMAIYLNYVNFPPYFSSHILSLEYRTKVIDELNEVRDRLQSLDLHPSLLESCNTLTAWAKEDQVIDNALVEKAIQFVTLSDTFRKRDIKNYIPEVWEELMKLRVQHLECK